MTDHAGVRLTNSNCTLAQRLHVLDELRKIWSDPTQPTTRRRKAKSAWSDLFVVPGPAVDPAGSRIPLDVR